MADDPNKDGKTSELDIIEGRAENLGDPVDVHLDDASGKERTAAPDGAKKPAEGQAEETPKPQDDGMEVLKGRIEEERRRRLAAESRERDATSRIKQFESGRQADQAKAIDTALREANYRREAAKRAYSDALSTNDPNKVADAVDALTAVSSEIYTLNEGKKALGAVDGDPRPHEGRVVPREPERAQHDPVEALASGLSSKSAEWVRNHPACVTDTRLNKKMLESHSDAIANNIRPDTPEYFDAIERGVYGTPAQERQDSQPVAEHQEQRREEPRDPPRRQQQSAAAPVRGGGTAATNGKGTRRTVTLTPQQRDAADSMEMSYQDYARNLVALEDEGRIKRSVN